MKLAVLLQEVTCCKRGFHWQSELNRLEYNVKGGQWQWQFDTRGVTSLTKGGHLTVGHSKHTLKGHNYNEDTNLTPDQQGHYLKGDNEGTNLTTIELPQSPPPTHQRQPISCYNGTHFDKHPEAEMHNIIMIRQAKRWLKEILIGASVACLY